MQSNPDSVATRLKLFMENKGLAITQFADMCSIPRPSMSQLLSGRNKKLSSVVVEQIHSRFPDLSVLWLMFGEGDMLLPAPMNPALVSEAAKFLGDEPAEAEFENLSELTSPDFSQQSIGLKASTPKNTPSREHYGQRSATPPPSAGEPRLRRVTSITVFYDDNSYETFLPEAKPSQRK